MRNPIVFLSLLLLPASSAVAENAAPAAVAAAAPAPAPALAAPVPASQAAAPSHPPKTLAGVDRHVTRTVTALMRQLAESRIPPQTRSGLSDRLLAVQEQASGAVKAGQAPAGQDVEGFSASLGKDLDAIAGAIDAASRRSL